MPVRGSSRSSDPRVISPAAMMLRSTGWRVHPEPGTWRRRPRRFRFHGAARALRAADCCGNHGIRRRSCLRRHEGLRPAGAGGERPGIDHWPPRRAGPRWRVGVRHACGMAAHAAILDALIARGITGQGDPIAVSLFDGLMACLVTRPRLGQRLADHCRRNRSPPPCRQGWRQPTHQSAWYANQHHTERRGTNLATTTAPPNRLADPHAPAPIQPKHRRSLSESALSHRQIKMKGFVRIGIREAKNSKVFLLLFLQARIASLLAPKYISTIRGSAARLLASPSNVTRPVSST